jgi:hypothetical protein
MFHVAQLEAVRAKQEFVCIKSKKVRAMRSKTHRPNPTSNCGEFSGERCPQAAIWSQNVPDWF